MAESQNLLGTINSRKDAVMALMKKEIELNVAIERTFSRVKQYQERELMLQMNNQKLQTQLRNLRESNYHLINKIAEKNCNCDKLRQQINYYEARNAKERKEARNALDAKIAYCRNAICGAYDEYKSVNLKSDKKVYEMKIAGGREEIHKREENEEELKEKFRKSCVSQEINETDRIIEMLSKEDEKLVREMRSKESEGSNLSRHMKQLNFEVVELKKK